MSSIVIIDYGSGNLRSAQKAFEYVAGKDANIVVTADASALRDASHIVLPGVGDYGDCIRGLSAISGMRDALEEEVIQKKKWFLGICVGMQLMLERGHEHGIHEGLGWIKGEVVRIGNGQEAKGKRESSCLLPPASCLKVPHMGWNTLSITKPHPLLAGIGQDAHAYFVHSYHAQCVHPEDVIATTDYGQPITAAIARGNMMGVQFHPEKSQETGLQLIQNFIAM